MPEQRLSHTEGRRKGWRDGSAAQVHTARAEDLGSVPGTHIRQLKNASNSGSRLSDAVFNHDTGAKPAYPLHGQEIKKRKPWGLTIPLKIETHPCPRELETVR